MMPSLINRQKMTKIILSVSKSITSEEWIRLMASVGFGKESGYCPKKVSQSIAAYPFVAHARTADGRLVGYVSAFSDHAFSTFIGEIVVAPLFQKQGIGRRLLKAVEVYSTGVPIYVNPLKDAEQFFIRQGFKHSSDITSALFKLV